MGRPRDGQIGSLGDVLGTNICWLGPIKRSSLIVCVVLIPTFDEVLAVDGLFGKKFPANLLSGGGLGAGGT